jgi:two-component system, OmpR family, sensor histidine kinase KdpD
VHSVAGTFRRALRGFAPTGLIRLVLVALPGLAAATGLVWLLEDRLGVQNAAPVYLVAVVVTALVAGTTGAVVSAVAAMLLYDFLFTQPLYTLTISDPSEWLNVVLLLFVALVVGQLTALERSRTQTASAREREARELFQVSRILATRQSTLAVLGAIAHALHVSTGLRGVRISLGLDDASERIAATVGIAPALSGGFVTVLRRKPGDTPAEWLRLHASSTPPSGSDRFRASDSANHLRVRIEAAGEQLGSIWGVQDRGAPLPDRSATRLLSAAADQIGQALAQDQLAAEARAAEVAVQSDALKSALLQSVSHDLRTPLAAIRAAVGGLRPESGLGTEERALSANAIEREVIYLDRLVTNLLDLSRIEAGALRAERDVFELDDVAGRTIERLSARMSGRPVTVDLPAAPVLVDPLFLDEALTNVLDNALKFVPPDRPIFVRGETDPQAGVVRLIIEDAGHGVPAGAMPRLFDKFYRASSPGQPARPGTGIGLAVARGLIEAMGGEVRARRSPLGGLEVELVLRLAKVPPALATISTS